MLKQTTIICTQCRCSCKDNSNLFGYFANQQGNVLAIEQTPQIPDITLSIRVKREYIVTVSLIIACLCGRVTQSNQDIQLAIRKFASYCLPDANRRRLCLTLTHHIYSDPPAQYNVGYRVLVCCTGSSYGNSLVVSWDTAGRHSAGGQWLRRHSGRYRGECAILKERRCDRPHQGRACV